MASIDIVVNMFDTLNWNSSDVEPLLDLIHKNDSADCTKSAAVQELSAKGGIDNGSQQQHKTRSSVVPSSGSLLL